MAIELVYKGGKSVQADWAQNDETAKDYIKNKPCYDDRVWKVVHEEASLNTNNVTSAGYRYVQYYLGSNNVFNKYPSGTTCKVIIDGEEYIGTTQAKKYIGNGSLYNKSYPDTGESFVVFDSGAWTICFSTKTMKSGTHTVSLSVLDSGSLHKLDPKYLPDVYATEKYVDNAISGFSDSPLLLDANSEETYLNNSSYGDTALEAIKKGRQILVKVPNASGDNYVANYSPVYMYQVPNHENNYLYLFFLKDEKQDLSSLLGLPAGTVQMPTYGQLKMKLSKTYNTNPLV